MAITGNIKELNIVDILQMLSLSQKSGRFKIINTIDNDTAYLYISSGRIVLGYLLSRDIKVKLLEKLRGDSGTGQYTDKYKELSIGDFLRLIVKDGSCSPSYIKDILIKEIQLVIYRIFKWNEGTFSFDESDVEKEFPVEYLPSVRIENVIMEGSRQIDEWGVINSKIKSLSDIVILDMASEDINEIDLTPREWMIISYINGARSVQDIIDIVGDEFETAKTIYGLLTAGICKLVSESNKAPLHKESIIKLIDDGKFSEALKAIKNKRNQSENKNDLLLIEAEIFWKTEQYDLAIRNYETYLNEVANLPSIVYDLALCYIFAGNIEKARSLIRSIATEDIGFEIIDRVEQLKDSIDKIWNMKNDRIPVYKRIEYDGSE
ncbi:DUF4388 domain-containing protein [candidate division WOR-3 bacterium]|nr:DUF4388 domain-containing protein [candidate division WOR-3 bacterium]